MEAVILAGGLGTRLGALAGNGSKPMVEISGRPFLEYPLLQLRRAGISSVVLCVGHRAAVTRDYFGSGASHGIEIRYSEEFEQRGTAGALKLAEALIEGDRFLVMNGDSLVDVALDRLLDSHLHHHAVATMTLARVEDRPRYGKLALDSGGQIAAFVEKVPLGRGELFNAGVYLFERQVLDLIPANRAVSLEYELFPVLVGAGLYGFPCSGFFVDIGVPSELFEIQGQPERLLQAAGLESLERC